MGRERQGEESNGERLGVGERGRAEPAELGPRLVGVTRSLLTSECQSVKLIGLRWACWVDRSGNSLDEPRGPIYVGGQHHTWLCVWPPTHIISVGLQYGGVDIQGPGSTSEEGVEDSKLEDGEESTDAALWIWHAIALWTHKHVSTCMHLCTHTHMLIHT